eukprot:g4221.t1
MGVIVQDQRTMEDNYPTRQSSRLLGSGVFIGSGSPFAMTIPTRQRTSPRANFSPFINCVSGTKTRLRNLKTDSFVFTLTNVDAEGTRNEVSIATQKEREVAEALSSLRNVKCTDELEFVSEHRWTTPKRRTQNLKRNGRNNTNTNSKRRMRTVSRRRHLESEDGSFSSGSYERTKRGRGKNRTQTKDRKSSSTPQRRTIFRLNGRRMYSNGLSESVSNGDGVPAKHQLRRQDRSEDPVSPVKAVNCKSFGDLSVSPKDSKNDPISLMTDEQYFPVAVRDAIQRLYGSTVICTRSEVQSVEDHQSPRILSQSTKTNGFKTANHTPNDAIDVGCIKNNSRHLQVAGSIQCKLQTLQYGLHHEVAHLHRREGVHDVLKNLPPSPIVAVHDDNDDVNHQFFPSLPMPMSFSSLSVQLPSLPQSLIHTIRSSATPFNGLQFPSFTPALIRESAKSTTEES